jgi:MarR family
MRCWSLLTNHARALLCIAHDPGARLRDIAAMVGVTERSAHDIVSDLVDAGYVVKDKAGRRNRYRIQEHLPLRDPISRERTIGEMLGYSSAPTHITEATRRRGPLLADNPPRKPRHGETHGNSLNETRAAKKLTRETRSS